MLSDPLHRLDSCVVTDSGGALVIVSEEVARRLGRTNVKILGHGEAPKHTNNGRIDLTYTGARWSGPRAFEEAGVTPKDIKYASIYDSFTITVVETHRGPGLLREGPGRQVRVRRRPAVAGRQAAVQLGRRRPVQQPPGHGWHEQTDRGRAPDAGRGPPGGAGAQLSDLALVHGTGGSLGTRMASSTLILGSEDA